MHLMNLYNKYLLKTALNIQHFIKAIKEDIVSSSQTGIEFRRNENIRKNTQNLI